MGLFDLTGKRALVTGSTQGIGFAIAKVLAEHGAKVFVHGGTSLEKCEKAAAQIPGATAVLAPLNDHNCADTLYAATGTLDILVLNASIQIRKPWKEITEEEYEDAVKTVKKLIKKLRKGKGDDVFDKERYLEVMREGKLIC